MKWLTGVLIVFAAADLIVAAITFVLYGRARMKEETKKEKQYLLIHSVSLFLLLLAGIVYMFFMVQTET